MIKICEENDCFLKTDPDTPKVTLQWSQSDNQVAKITKSHHQTPKVTPIWPQNALGWESFSLSSHAQARLDQAKSAAKMCISSLRARLGRTQGDMICIKCEIRRLYAQNDPKMNPKSASYAQSNPKVTPNLSKTQTVAL